MSQFFYLSEAEVSATQRALDVLRDVSWAAPLLRRIAETGGLSAANMPSLFEVRIALALHDCLVTPEYEYAAGVGNTTVDFKFGSWLVELYSFDESDALKAATWHRGHLAGRLLTTYQPIGPMQLEEDRQRRHGELALLDASSEPDGLKHAIRREVMAEAKGERQQQEDLAKQSTEAEIVKAIERVVGKATHDKQPAKFPISDGSRLSMLIVDARALGVAGPDQHDCRLIAYGADAVPDFVERQFVAGDGRAYPIRGAFDPRNPMEAAQTFRERVHFLGIVAEETYDRDELQYSIRFYPNKNLFSSDEEAYSTLSTFPLFQPRRLRKRRPELSLDEMTRLHSPTEINFATLVDGQVLRCRVHRDTLEDLEKRSLNGDAEDFLETFERRKLTLRYLAVEKYKRDQVEGDALVFLRPDDLLLLR
jgi:hypothetical protein